MKAVESPVSNYYSAIVYYTIADLLHQEAKYEESINYLNKYFTLLNLVDDLPSSAGALLANYVQGYNYLKIKDYKNALLQFEKSRALMMANAYPAADDVRKQRLYADLVSRMADCNFKENRYQIASDDYKIASKINFPGQDYAFFQRSMIQGLLGNAYEKIVLLEDLIETVPLSSFVDDAFFQIGEAQLGLGNSREAELAFKKIVSGPNRSNLKTRALLKLGLIVYNKGDIDQAITFYEGVFKNNPNKDEAQEALLALKEIYVEDLGRAEDFVAILEKATGYKMTSFEKDSLSYVAAQGRFDNGEYIAAIDSYTKYIKQFPSGINYLQAIYNRAESHSILKEYDKALPDYDRIISLGQSDYYEDAIFKASLIAYNDLQRFEEAFNYYNLLNEVTSDELLQYEAQIGGLRSAYRFGDKEAVLYMANLIINNSLTSKEDKSLAYLFSGKMHYQGKSWDAAIANLQQVPKLVDNENAAESKYLYNEVLFVKGEVVQAEVSTLETVSNSTAYPYWVAKNLILYGDIMLDRLDLFNARAALEAVLENFPESDELTSQAQTRLDVVKAKEAEMTRIENETNTIQLDTIKGNE
jgi:tetratricopeptide (TPR) repeat protein